MDVSVTADESSKGSGSSRTTGSWRGRWSKNDGMYVVKDIYVFGAVLVND